MTLKRIGLQERMIRYLLFVATDLHFVWNHHVFPSDKLLQLCFSKTTYSRFRI